MAKVPDKILELSREIKEENGQREEMLCAKCRWEQRTRSAILMEYGDPVEWLDMQEAPHE